MSKIKKVTAVLLSVIMLVCMFSVPAGAKTFEAGDDFEYKDYSFHVYRSATDGTKFLRIKNYYGKESKVTLPTKVYGMRVSGIENFPCNGTVKTLIIPEGYVYLSNIDGGDTLTTVKLPNTLSGISKGFTGCHALKSLDIPASVKTIKGYSFMGCDSLKTLKLKNGLEVIGDDAFNSSSLKNITLPKSLTKIGCRAFSGCDNLKSITIPNYL